MTTREFPGDAAGQSAHGTIATYVVYVGGEDTREHSDARMRDDPFRTKERAIEAGRLHAAPGETITVWRVDPEAPEETEWTRVYGTRAPD